MSSGIILPLKTNRLAHSFVLPSKDPRNFVSRSLFEALKNTVPNHNICLAYRPFYFLLVVMMSLFCPVQSICKSLSIAMFSYSINEDSDSDVSVLPQISSGTQIQSIRPPHNQ